MDNPDLQRLHRLDADADPFRFLDLPQELRDLIYSHCLRPEFRQCTLLNIHSSYRLQVLEATEDQSDRLDPSTRTQQNYCCMSSLMLEDQYESHWVLDDKPYFVDDGASILTYRLGDALSLLLVSRQINHELTSLVKDMYSTFDAAIETHHIKSPSSAFLDACVHTRFIFDAGPSRALNFLSQLPSEMKPLVCDVAFISTCVFSTAPWDVHRAPNHNYDPVDIPWEDRWLTEQLLPEFPNLKSIAIEVPGHADQRKEFYADGALQILPKLLLAGVVDVVRLLYRKRSADPRCSTDQLFIYNTFDRFIDMDPPQHQQAQSQAAIASNVSRRFNVVEVPPWTVGEHGTWFSETDKMERLVEITRCEGTELVPLNVKPFVIPPCFCQCCNGS